MDRRYEELRRVVARVGEGPPLLQVPPKQPELELQARWFAGAYGREFVATDGRRVRLVQPGVWNREAGPDFAEAAVQVEEEPVQRGAIELDWDARDWEHHGHATNPAYDRVVLHVFFVSGAGEFFTRTSAHRNVPQVLLPLQPESHAPEPEALAKPGRCVGPLRTMPEETVKDVLRSAARFRLRAKAAKLRAAIDAHDFDEALYQAVATTLGYKSNKLPFSLLAQRLPLRMLRESGELVEPLLFGVSGFLTEPDLARFEPDVRRYLQKLWESWWAERAAHERLIIPKKNWRMTGQRPVNHPQRRLAALACLVEKWAAWKPVAERSNPPEVKAFLGKLRHPFWERHYTLAARPSPKPMALVGATRVTELLANVLFPLAITQDEARWADYEKLPAELTNRPVETAAVRLFGASGTPPLLRTPAMQQGLLQVYEDFCIRDESDCAVCRFPEQVAQWR